MDKSMSGRNPCTGPRALMVPEMNMNCKTTRCFRSVTIWLSLWYIALAVASLPAVTEGTADQSVQGPTAVAAGH
jgi:hypothetical protein